MEFSVARARGNCDLSSYTKAYSSDSACLSSDFTSICARWLIVSGPLELRPAALGAAESVRLFRRVRERDNGLHSQVRAREVKREDERERRIERGWYRWVKRRC